MKFKPENIDPIFFRLYFQWTWDAKKADVWHIKHYMFRLFPNKTKNAGNKHQVFCIYVLKKYSCKWKYFGHESEYYNVLLLDYVSNLFEIF